MNQILSMSKNKKVKNINKAVRTFCILTMVFAIIIIAMAVLAMVNNKKDKLAKNSIPEINIEIGENYNAIISVKSSQGLAEVTYTWNDTDITKKILNGGKEWSTAIEIPEGENTISVKATSSNGKIIQANKQFTREPLEALDNEKPEILLEAKTVENNYTIIKITATDNKEMAYIKYKLDEEEEKVITEEGTNEITTEIELQRGVHTLVVVAEDKKGNKTEKQQQFNIVNKPEISVIKSNDIIKVKVEHDMGFEKIELTVNDKLWVYDSSYSGYDPNETELEFSLPLEEGENIVKINAYSLEGEEGKRASAEYIGKCTY